tara:strand:- start:6491 stop:7468 length:978 start_codon:yes stop_codon:yes gene_type:complete
MNFEIIILTSSLIVVLILVLGKIITTNSLSKERLRVLIEKQEGLEKSLHNILERSFEKIDYKVEKTSNENSSNLQKIKEKIALIDRAQQNISGLTENVIDLKNILSNTSQRGRFGEIILENLVKDYLPKENYSFQKTLSNNTRVDCMINSSGPLDKICIDAKFPREGYEKILKSTNNEEKKRNIKIFKSDITNHLTEVKNKYIIAGETSDIALIFIPSEMIYLEIFNFFPELSQKFYEFKTFLISPTTLWIILNSIESLTRDKRIKESTGLIFQQLKDLTDEISRLEIRVKKMDSHFSSAQNDLNDILITTKKISNKKNNLLKLK